MPTKFRQWVGWGLIVLLFIWIIANFKPADVNMLVFEVRIPVALLIFFSAAMGAGAIFALKYIRTLRGQDPPK